MKNREKSILIQITLLIFFWIIIFLTAFFIIDAYVNLNQTKFIILMIIFVVFALAISYMIANFSLKSLFNTNRLLDKLLEDTLHELNLPIATIQANIQILKKKETNLKNIQRLDRIIKASNNLLKMYEDLDYYIKREIQKENREEFNLKPLIEEIVNDFSAITIKTNFVLNLYDMHVFTDKDGFKRILSNLITNAIKHNNSEKPIVNITLLKNKLTIKDNGIGMNQEEIVHIFERYYQTNHNKSGYGIGLSIVKAYCDDNGIVININSKKNKGTKFILNLVNILIKNT